MKLFKKLSGLLVIRRERQLYDKWLAAGPAPYTGFILPAFLWVSIWLTLLESYSTRIFYSALILF